MEKSLSVSIGFELIQYEGSFQVIFCSFDRREKGLSGHCK